MLVAWSSSEPSGNYASLWNADGRLRKPLPHSPWHESFFFWYKKRLLSLRIMPSDDHPSSAVDISISSIGWSPNILEDFLSECRTKHLEFLRSEPSVFKHCGNKWERVENVGILPSCGLILAENKWDELRTDIECFLAPHVWYCGQNIPYRKGYLFHGPSGSGKSSLSLHIANQYHLDMYILSISSLDDCLLHELIGGIPAHCLVLLEDIDLLDAAQSQGLVSPGMSEYLKKKGISICDSELY